MQWNCILIKVFVQFLKNRKDRCGGEADFRRKFPDHGKNRVKLLVKYRDKSHGILRLIINLPLISLLPGEGGKRSEPDEGKIRN